MRVERKKTHKIAETVQHRTRLHFSIDGCQHLRRDMLMFSKYLQFLNRKVPSATSQDKVQIQFSEKCPAVAGSRLALQLIPVKRLKNESFQSHGTDARVLFFLVTTSLSRDQGICASTAFGRIPPGSKLQLFNEFIRPGAKTVTVFLKKNAKRHNCSCIRQLTPKKKGCMLAHFHKIPTLLIKTAKIPRTREFPQDP